MVPKKFAEYPNKDAVGHISDPVVSAMGEWGPWQRRQFLLVGMFYIPCCFPVLNLLFMNAAPDFYCDMAPDMRGALTVEEWRNVSGQEDQSCRIRDLNYHDIL